jgi:hypothetical protein
MLFFLCDLCDPLWQFNFACGSTVLRLLAPKAFGVDSRFAAIPPSQFLQNSPFKMFTT